MTTNELYNNSFRINAASVLLHKSSRKNARCSDVISINHLIDTENRMITDERIMDQFINVLEKVVYTSLQFNKHLEVTVYMDTGKNSQYTNASNAPYKTWEHCRYTWQRVKFGSLEGCINFLYTVFAMIYPYNELNLDKTVYRDPRVADLIREYYHNK